MREQLSQIDTMDPMAETASGTRFLLHLVRRVRALSKHSRIVFPEGRDARVAEAAARLRDDNLITPVLIAGDTDDRYASRLFDRRRAKGMTLDDARRLASTPLYFAALMVAAGDADGMVGGAANTTADTVRAALHSIGPQEGIRTVSSSFIIGVADTSFGADGLLTFADCALVIEPTAEELAGIAKSAAATTRALLGVEPVVAMLSFSTKGSAGHESIEIIRNAVAMLHRSDPSLQVDGELQADAALVPWIGESKARGSLVAGRANTLIFPNLAAGNIAVKLVERLGGATAVGPVLQGLGRPVNDLSRGCSVQDIYTVALITALQGCNELCFRSS